jgi:hypothetical protein
MSTSNSLLQFFQKLRLPLYRDKEDITHVHIFLEKRFNTFLAELDKVLIVHSDESDIVKQIREELGKRKENVKKLCQAIIASLIAYRNGEVLEAHRIFENKMDEVKDEIASCDMKAVSTQLFRIRPGKFKERKDLFHIPFEETTKVKAYRYSIAGFPCLYLSGNMGEPRNKDMGLPLAWLECDTPSKFSWSEFKFADKIETMKLIDLTVSPFSSALGRQGFFTRIIKNDVTVKDEIIRFIVTYPLIAACSLVVMDKGKPFSSEYTIPQILLLWIHNKGNQSGYRGIKYFSCTRHQKAREYRAFNVVLPAQKNAPLKGYCPELKQELELSEPKFIDVQEIFKSLSSRYKEVLLYRNELNQKLTTGHLVIATMAEILSLCSSLINLYEKVCSEETQNVSWVFDYIETLDLVSRRMIKDEYCDAMIREAKDFPSSNPKEDEDFCREIHGGFKKVHEFISGFRNFGFTYFYQELDTFESIK